MQMKEDSKESNMHIRKEISNNIAIATNIVPRGFTDIIRVRTNYTANSLLDQRCRFPKLVNQYKKRTFS